ncbi:MAG: DUF1538 domain-containing protein [Tissierellia bacterium]|nr:DUF1538 domain-containing protein [Tissierellia bacterium]
MNLLQEKVREVGQSLFPIVILVLLIIFGLVDIDYQVILRFLAGAAFLFVGLSIFLWGVDQSMNPIGFYMASELAGSKKLLKALILAFLLGFLINIAEPDLIILGSQVELASGGQISGPAMVALVSVGVGIMVTLASLQILMNKKYNVLMASIYLFIFILAVFVAEEFVAISFDASGATTGALTTPFILAISLGLAKVKGGAKSEEDAFGMVGAMSAGPMPAVMIMAILTGQTHIQGQAQAFVQEAGILGPLFRSIPGTLLDSLRALGPIALLFFFFNYRSFKLSKKELIGIIRGLIYTFLGLTFFLVGANHGFMDMGRLIGMGIAENHTLLLPLFGFLTGLIVVLAEPAVHVLGEQIREVSAGAIPIKLIRLTLSIGVGSAIALSTLRIMIPSLKLWYFLLPGFTIAVILSFFAEPIFVGIAYDAGGVASGPMSATFVLAFAQGAADMIPTANVLVDGFGVIAMIAMAPVLSLMILGTIVAHRNKKQEDRMLIEGDSDTILDTIEVQDYHKDLVFIVLPKGKAQDLINLARDQGAQGATVLHGRDARVHALSGYSLKIDPEKEVVLLAIDAGLTQNMTQAFLNEKDLSFDSIMVLPISSHGGFERQNKKEIDK